MSIHRGLAALTAALSLLASCASGDSGKAGTGSAGTQDPAAPGSAAQASASASGGPSAGGTQGVFEIARCGDRLAKLKAEPALTGAPDFEANRVELAGRPRGTSLLWTRVPAVDPRAPASAAAALAKLSRTDKPLTIVKGLLRRYAKSPEVLRSVILREGYVYAADPGVALALVESLRLTHLFREDAVFLLRGKTVHALRRAAKTRYLPERYLHEDGALKGSVAELLLGDRVSLDRGHLTTSPAALDLASASADEGFDRMRVTHLSASGLVAEVRYPGGVWVTALFDIDGPGLRLA
ncbi:MAG: hypothetical protein R3F14_01690 [Polyangiaceae bacterium]